MIKYLNVKTYWKISLIHFKDQSIPNNRDFLGIMEKNLKQRNFKQSFLTWDFFIVHLSHSFIFHNLIIQKL